MGCHREPLLDQLALGGGLEDQPVGGVEHPVEDGQMERRLVVGGRMQDGRHPSPSMTRTVG
jgi:hypothetical protein